jgi:transcriptional regulator with XRE-family HTH domain
MITHFNFDNCTDSGVVFRSVLEQIEMIYEDDPALAGEFAIAAIHIILTNENNSNDKVVRLSLKQMEAVAANNRSKRESKVTASREAKIKNKKLDIIAELHSQGLTQKQIAAEVGESQQTVSNRLGMIRAEFPELLEEYKEYKKDYKEYKEYKEYKPNVNVNVNVNVNESEREEVPSIEETSFDDVLVYDEYGSYPWSEKMFTNPGSRNKIINSLEQFPENQMAIDKARELGLL